jgi:hypothetical protein
MSETHSSEEVTPPLTMCECGHAAIYHYAHGRCGNGANGNWPAHCACLNLVIRRIRNGADS